MLNLDPNAYDVHEQYRQDRINQAEHHRLVQIAKQYTKSPSITRKCVTLFGKMLVALGQTMQQQPTATKRRNTISRPIV